MKVGFIGLGTMGASMAANLQKAGYELVVHDIRRAAAERHMAAGAIWADSPKALAEQCEVIFTSLPGPPEVEEVALGANGLLAGMKDGSAYFDLSTNSPTRVRELNRRFAEKHVYMLDAPVSGGPKGAASGRLALWIGGDEQIFNRHKKVLDAIGDQARYMARSAPARWPSWCTTAPATRSRPASPKPLTRLALRASHPSPRGRGTF